ncbi:hypothetical protein [Thermopetrobacter sp. TC1]|uniref:hypothetical protein n=1 Tax=Thermopetrobacter sp. TC1 TaxID=1495045 RepID=UPI000571938F|nr:hypothetical protein [Thermopetrobacter sp. TC1]
MKIIKGAIAISALSALLAIAPVTSAEEAKSTGGDIAQAYGDAAKAMTDSMMLMMSAMFKMYNETTKPMWSSMSQIFGDYGEWCTACHAPLSNIYDQLGESFDPNVHKKLSDAELKKALEAYQKSKQKKDAN